MSVRLTADRAANGVTALSRLMGNISGPKSSKRRRQTISEDIGKEADIEVGKEAATKEERFRARVRHQTASRQYAPQDSFLKSEHVSGMQTLHEQTTRIITI